MKRQSELVYDVSNGAISNDLEWPQRANPVHAIIWRWMSQKQYKIDTVTNLQTPYSTV